MTWVNTPAARTGIAAAALAALALLEQSLFIVNQTEQALVRRLGEVVRHVPEPGLGVKIPLVEDVIRYDNRLLSVYFDQKEVVIRGDETNDNKRVIVDAFAKYRIKDPLAFYRSVRTETVLSDRLTQIFESAMRRAMGGVTLEEALSSGRKKVMEEIKRNMNIPALQFGVEVVDVRIVRTDLPKNNSRAVFERMTSQHEKEARQTRAEGEEASQTVKAEADKTVRVLLAEAKKKAELLRGAGEAEASGIYAQAYSSDPEFYGFYRTMQAYRAAFAEGTPSSKVVAGPKNTFFRYMDDMSLPQTKGRGAAAADAPQSAEAPAVRDAEPADSSKPAAK